MKLSRTTFIAISWVGITLNIFNILYSPYIILTLLSIISFFAIIPGLISMTKRPVDYVWEIGGKD